MKLTEAKLRQLVKEGFDTYLAQKQNSNDEIIRLLIDLSDLLINREKYGITTAVLCYSINNLGKQFSLLKGGFIGNTEKNLNKLMLNDNDFDYFKVFVKIKQDSKLGKYIKECNAPETSSLFSDFQGEYIFEARPIDYPRDKKLIQCLIDLLS